MKITSLDELLYELNNGSVPMLNVTKEVLMQYKEHCYIIAPLTYN